LKLLSPSAEEAVIEAITQAEQQTSGEIRVHMEQMCFGEAFPRAIKLFHQLGMDKTDARNGILIYIATESRKLAIVGDEGIHAKVGQAFWDELSHILSDGFKKANYKESLVTCIQRCGELLAIHFPYTKDDKNELSNDISFG